MIVDFRTTPDEFLHQTRWVLDSPSDRGRFAVAFEYMLKNVPLGVLNLPDHSSPWTPGKGQRTTLLSWLQAIRFSASVYADEPVSKGAVLKQFRRVSDPPGTRGHWYTLTSSKLRFTALPKGHYRAEYYIAIAGFRCLFSRAADAFAGWDARHDSHMHRSSPYRHGGAVQYFIYSGGSLASCLVPAELQSQ